MRNAATGHTASVYQLPTTGPEQGALGWNARAARTASAECTACRIPRNTEAGLTLERAQATRTASSRARDSKVTKLQIPSDEGAPRKHWGSACLAATIDLVASQLPRTDSSRPLQRRRVPRTRLRPVSRRTVRVPHKYHNEIRNGRRPRLQDEAVEPCSIIAKRKLPG